MISSKALKNTCFYLGFFVFFLIVYYSVIAYSYAFTDSYFFIYSAFHNDIYNRVESVYAGGRPIYALLLYAFHLATNLESLKLLKLVSIAGISALALFLTNFLGKKTSYSFPVRASIAAIIGLIPAFQVYATWAVCAFYPWAALLAVISFSILDSETKNTRKKLVLSFIVLCLSITIYQPAAMMFWVAASMSWLVADRHFPQIKRLLLAAILMLASMATDFLFAKTLPHLIYGPVAHYTRTALVSNFEGKAIWFFSEVMRDALNLISIRGRHDVAIFVALFILLGMAASIPGRPAVKFGKIILAFLLLIGAYFPNLITQENWASYRTQVALTSLLVFYAAIALTGWAELFRVRRLKTPLFISAAICSGYVAGHNVLVGFAKPETLELKLIASYLVRHDGLAGAKQIYLVPSTWRDTLSPVMRYDEFGIPSSCVTWALQGMTWLLLKQQHSPAADKIGSAIIGPLADAPKGATIVDFGKILRP